MLGAISQRGKHFLLHYKYVPDMTTLRTPFRAAHLALASEFSSKGLLVWGGAYQHPIDGGEFMFHCESDETVKEFMRRDPYMQAGLISAQDCREVMIVAGSLLPKQ